MKLELNILTKQAILDLTVDEVEIATEKNINLSPVVDVMKALKNAGWQTKTFRTASKKPKNSISDKELW